MTDWNYETYEAGNSNWSSQSITWADNNATWGSVGTEWTFEIKN